MYRIKKTIWAGLAIPSFHLCVSPFCREYLKNIQMAHGTSYAVDHAEFLVVSPYY